MNHHDGPQSQVVLHSFLSQIIDGAVRDWGRLSTQVDKLGLGAAPRFEASPDISRVWWQSLWSSKSKIEWPASREHELTRFFQAWQSWTHRVQPAADAAFRLCFRLEPPEFDTDSGRVVSADWILRYFLQAHDDPSLLVPAQQVWRERGSTLSYLNHRFDQPQEKLLAGLGMAARLCPAIERSLKSQCPDSATLTAQEAYNFLRETARLLEGVGLGVMVPPWWNKPDTRLRVRIKMRSKPESGSGLMGLNALVSYDWELALGDEPLTREEFERLAALKTPLVQVRGRWVLLQPDQVEAAIAFWEKQRERADIAMADALRVALGAQTEIDGLALGEVELDDQLSQLLDRLAGGDQIEALPSPPDLHGQLRPYQNRGFSWLIFLRQWGFGACLADDMGLGKTIQVLSLLLVLRRARGERRPSLLVAPASLLLNWSAEIERFAPTLEFMVAHTSAMSGDELTALDDQRLAAADLVITSYGTLLRCPRLASTRWRLAVLDEAQAIKNPGAKQTRAVKLLQADARIALTGTPIENRLSDLWSVFDFINPGLLGSAKDFASYTKRLTDGSRSPYGPLRNLVRPYILRRLKTDKSVITDLPEKTEIKAFCSLSRKQVALYQQAVEELGEQLDAVDGMKRRGLVLAFLMRMKQICNHPSQWLGDGAWAEADSGKWARLRELGEVIAAKQEKALVFTQFRQVIGPLAGFLGGVFGRPGLVMHGETEVKKRKDLVRRFQEDESVPFFLLSLKAGGAGLSLTAAAHVIHFDRWWNPAVENQATDRAFRIGQTKNVLVHKFVCRGTVEDKIDALIESKQALTSDLLEGGAELNLTEMKDDELLRLVSLDLNQARRE